jgi:hypothetical protein
LLEKLGVIQRDGMLLSLAERYGTGLPSGGNYYQFGAMDTLLHLWRQSGQPSLPRPSLTALPPSRHFADVGWVSMQSHWDKSGDTIMLGFKSSSTGAVSHAFGEQNAFVINAYRRAMAISTGVRDLYGSEHYERWTRDARSKNMVLVDGQGPIGRDRDGTGRILRFVSTARCDLTSGDASQAYRRNATQVLRHVLFADRRYFVMLDEIETDHASSHEWLLHTPVKPRLDPDEASVHVDMGDRGLRVDMLLPQAVDLAFSQHDRLVPAPIPGAVEVPPAWHNRIETLRDHRSRRFLIVLRPWKDEAPSAPATRRATVSGHAADIGTDTVLMADEAVRSVRTADGQLALDGHVAWLGRKSATLLQGSMLRTPGFELESSTPISADFRLQPSAWSVILNPGESVTLQLRAATDARPLAMPEGSQWRRESDRLVLVLPARQRRSEITIASS